MTCFDCIKILISFSVNALMDLRVMELTIPDFMEAIDTKWKDMNNCSYECLPEKTNQFHMLVQGYQRTLRTKISSMGSLLHQDLKSIMISVLKSGLQINFDTKVNCSLLLLDILVCENPESFKEVCELISTLENTIALSSSSESPLISLLSIFIGLLVRLESSLLTKLKELSYKSLMVHIPEFVISLPDRFLNCVTCMASARALKQWSQKLLALMKTDSGEKVISGHYEDILDTVGKHLFTQLQNRIDSVRYMSKETFADILKLQFSLRKSEVEQIKWKKGFVSFLQNSSQQDKSVYMALDCALDIIHTEEILLYWPTIVGDLLQAGVENRELSTYVGDCLVRLSCHDKSPSDVWLHRWISPILQFNSHLNNVKEGFFSNLLKYFLKSHPETLLFLFKENGDQVSCNTLLDCLKVARKLGILPSFNPLIEKNGDPMLWKGLLSYDKIEKALFNSSVKVGVNCISVLCESSKTTELFFKIDLDLISKYLEMNLILQSASSRQEILAYFKKCLWRCKEGGFMLAKLISKKDSCNLRSVLQYHHRFLMDITAMCFKNLFPGSNFSRRSASLKILELIDEAIGYKSAIYPLGVLVDEQVLNCLKLCIFDSYDLNKKLATNLIISFYHQGIRGKFDSDIEFKLVLKLSQSLKPSNTASAIYFVKIFSTYSENLNLNFFSARSIDNECHMAIGIISYFMEIFETHLKKAKQSLLECAGVSPMYGIALILHGLIAEVPLVEFENYSLWGPIIKRLIKACFQASEAVWPVVSSVSPEGLLPHDIEHSTLVRLYEAFDCKFNDQEAPLTSGRARSFASQMLLLCCWRTVKETSLLLGYLCSVINHCLPAYLEIVDSDMLTLKNPQSLFTFFDDKGSLCAMDVVFIGNHFIRLLSEVKHRGAFEQVYVGFCQFVSQLWRSKNKSLQFLPIHWLRVIMKDLEDLSTTLSCTRRSGGLPFLIQALLSTNPNLKYCKSVEYTYGILMKHIKKKCQGDSIMLETKVHCLNIMRSLFKDTRMRDVNLVYLAEGLILSIEGFKSKSWAVRNASTLLFSVLNTRIFGVKHTAKEIKIGNCITGNALFKNHPSLYAYFLAELSIASCLGEQTSIYPVLLVLSRLYPSSYEGINSGFNLVAFHPSLVACSANKNYRIRELAAEAVASLLMKENCGQLLSLLMKQLKDHIFQFNNNGIHGVLLQIFCVYKVILENKTKETGFDAGNLIDQFQNLLVTLLTTETPHLILGTIFRVLNLFTIHGVLSESHHNSMKLFIWNDIHFLYCGEEDAIIGSSPKRLYFLGFSLNFIASLNMDHFTEDLFGYLLNNFQLISDECQLVFIKFSLFIFKNQKGLDIPSFEKEIFPYVWDGFSCNSPCMAQKFLDLIYDHKDFINCLFSMCIKKKPSVVKIHYAQLLLLLMKNADFNILTLHHVDSKAFYLILENPEELLEFRCQILLLFAYLRQHSEDHFDADCWMMNLTRMLENDLTISCKVICAEALVQVVLDFLDIDSKCVYDYWESVIVLLKDSEGIVRETISLIISKLKLKCDRFTQYCVSENSCPTAIIQCLLESICSGLSQKNKLKTLIWLISLILTIHPYDWTYSDFEDQQGAFEKNDCSDFVEDIPMVDIIVNVIEKKIVNEGIIDTEISSEYFTDGLKEMLNIRSLSTITLDIVVNKLCKLSEDQLGNFDSEHLDHLVPSLEFSYILVPIYTFSKLLKALNCHLQVFKINLIVEKLECVLGLVFNK